jgi:hypothetical protein
VISLLGLGEFFYGIQSTNVRKRANCTDSAVPLAKEQTNHNSNSMQDTHQ